MGIGPTEAALLSVVQKFQFFFNFDVTSRNLSGRRLLLSMFS